ncbi:MAG: hypothetical protein KJ070_23505 [Verrucomicrobia bacterium]|nr:hypothetical protein [Verrucomicrobiota bacterium]
MGELVISTNITIIGPGADVLRLDGNGSNRVFNITGGTVSISGLTITNGYVEGYGGGMVNAGTVYLFDCAFLGNSAAGVLQRGGGIYSSGLLYASGCSFQGNVATRAFSFGGGLNLANLAGLTNCTIAGNSSDNGGGIYSLSAAITIESCTISSNWGRAQAGGVKTTGCTIRNSIVAGNITSSKNTGEGNDVNGPFVSLGYNLIGETNGSSGLGAIGDQLGTTNTPINPNLQPLGYYGGTTLIAPPAPGSPAIDQGKSSGLATDQRGRPRPFDNPGIVNATLGDGADIGAVELGSATLVVTTTNDSGAGSLRAAVSSALAGEIVTVTFAPGVTNVITLTNGQLSLINQTMSIIGPGAGKLTISGNNASRVLLLSGGNTTISGLTFAQGLTNEGAGLLVQGGIHVLDSCQVLSNSVNAFGFGGGGVSSSSNATLTMLNTTVGYNQARFTGGGINHGSSGLLAMTNCTVSGNRVTEIPDIITVSGAGIANGSGTLSLSSCTVSSNSSSGGGGGIANNPFSPGTINLRNTIVAGNTAAFASKDVEGPFVSGGYNLIGITNLASGFGAAGDQLNANPMLGPLGDNGGPTLTLALLSKSPAIDKGKSFGTSTDQRGAPRPFDFSSLANASGSDGSDIGAFESGSPLLNIQPIGNGAVLSWPWFYGDFALQSSTNVTSTPSWIAAGGSAFLVGEQYRQTNAPINGNIFFRLQQK